MRSDSVLTPAPRDAGEIHGFEPPDAKALHRHRWIDLGLVLLVAFVPSIGTSVYHLFYPAPHNYTNAEIAVGLLHELTALTLFVVLFSRQNRRVRELGISFHWTDLPKGLYLLIGSFITAFLASYATRSTWFLMTHKELPVGVRSTFAATSFWLLVPFLILNPFFEEILVRGYLMTEIIELRSSVVLGTLISISVQTSYHLYYGVEGAIFVGGGLAIFALYYAKTRQLAPVIVAHMLWDLLALVRG